MFKARCVTLRNGSQPEIEPLYRFWRDNWGTEFKVQSLLGIDTSNSDDFRSSDFVRSIWSGPKIVSTMLISRFDLSVEWDRKASYFNGWPQELFELYQGKTIWALRYFLVAPEFRSSEQFKVGFVTAAFCFKDFLSSSDDAVVGMTLKRFGAHAIAHKFGMKQIGPDGQTKHGVEVEYSAVARNEINLKLVSELTRGIVDQLEERRPENLLGPMTYKKASGFP